MNDKSELEKTVEYALGGTPQLKPDEKRKWLGEFRERVILGVTVNQVYENTTKKYVEEALKDHMADILIVNQKIHMNIISEYMVLARDANKEFKTVAANNDDAMGIVVVSRQAVERENIEIKPEEVREKVKSDHSENDNEENEEKDTEGIENSSSNTIWNKLGRFFKK